MNAPAGPAKRPLNSRLQTTKVERELGIKMQMWQGGLAECLQRMFVVVPR